MQVGCSEFRFIEESLVSVEVVVNDVGYIMGLIKGVRVQMFCNGIKNLCIRSV